MRLVVPADFGVEQTQSNSTLGFLQDYFTNRSGGMSTWPIESRRSQITIFAHNRAVTAIAFPGEATNYNSVAVATIEVVPEDSIVEKLAEGGVSSGVGSPWPPVKSETAAPAPAARPTRKRE